MAFPPTLGTVKDVNELRVLAEALRKQFAPDLVLFRGQTSIFPRIRSGRARVSAKITLNNEAGWSALGARLLTLTGHRDTKATAPKMRAILQHYGFVTNFVDLTADPSIAAWFATNEYSPDTMRWVGGGMFREIKLAQYNQKREGVGHILILRIPDAFALQQNGNLINLSELPVDFLRPHRQSGWLMFDRPPVRPNPNDYWVGTIEIDRQSFLNSAEIGRKLFPPPREDAAYSALLHLPFVQVPAPFFADASDDVPEDQRTFERRLWWAVPAFEVPEYEFADGDGTLDRKWSDLTLYEPETVRLWKGWRFSLASIHEGIQGEFHESTKITLSPGAFEALKHMRVPRGLSWPTLPTNDIFFSFAVLDHDKVIEHGPPYHGVWLHREGDLIIEQQTSADDEVLNQHAGHAYLLSNGKLQRQDISMACQCGHPGTHLELVKTVLKLQSAIDKKIIALIPHPSGIPDWYFAL